ncbi:hypothetical protein [Primorskyibacter sp. S87]|uniref:hypothetical protein n=1 Tax=Primorskyibacter sp. S87 TaxID=3415126 RepID=UPI003C7C960A
MNALLSSASPDAINTGLPDDGEASVLKTLPGPVQARKIRTRDGCARSDLDVYLNNPHQRNTDGRAGHASAAHLAILQPPHLEFDVVHCIADGKDYLLNGHTRRQVWNDDLQDDPAQKPEFVNITEWEAETLDDVVALYEMFDASEAVKNLGDEVFGTMRELQMMPSSALIMGAGWLEGGLRMIRNLAHGEFGVIKRADFNLKAALDEAREEIGMLDSLMFGDKVEIEDSTGKLATKKTPKPTAVAATVMLFILIRDGVEALPFLEAVRGRHGTVAGEEFDPVYGWYSWEKSGQRLAYRNRADVNADMLRRADWQVYINCYEAWRNDLDSLDGYPHGRKAHMQAVLDFNPYAKRRKQ